jgi:phthiodiolone/phenolphthiodiolone dimycocerosates ketoreductase
MWETPEQMANKLKTFGGVGLQHVVIVLLSPAISKRAALYGLRATCRSARLLGSRR